MDTIQKEAQEETTRATGEMSDHNNDISKKDDELLHQEAQDETTRIIGASVEETAKILANSSNNSNLHQYASLRSLSARGLHDLQKKMNCLNSPTIHAASALLAASAPPAFSLGAAEPPLIPAPRYGSAAMTIRTLGPNERKRVPHVYHDYGQVPDAQEFSRKKTGGVTQPFPEKLMDMLNRESEGHIVEWLPHGRAFIVRKPDDFTSVIMPKYFRQTKITSFQRQLNLYGFRRITQGADSGAYYHELFLRGRPNLCAQMIRTKVKGTGHKQPSDVTSEPNFYAMPAQPLLCETSSSTLLNDAVRNNTRPAFGQGQVPFSPHLHGAANLLKGISQGRKVGNLPELNLEGGAKASQNHVKQDPPTKYDESFMNLSTNKDKNVNSTHSKKDEGLTSSGKVDEIKQKPSPLAGDASEIKQFEETTHVTCV